VENIDIPFLPEWEGLMLTGKKTATSRTKRYGLQGDYFEAFGRVFILTDVYRIRLSYVACYHYLEEGCNSDFEFRKIWERLHPRKGFCPDQRVYFHRFKLQNSMYQWHVHELTDNGRCRICGCDPTPVLADLAPSPSGLSREEKTADIYSRALKAWGAEAQLGMTQEECAELIKVINKYFRGKADKAKVIEECVDAELMINQMRELFKDDRNTWDRIKIEKIERLNDLLEL